MSPYKRSMQSYGIPVPKGWAKSKPAPKTKALAKRVRKIERSGELKRFTSVITTNPLNTGIIQHLSFVAEGIGSNQRNGLKIQAKAVSIKIRVAQDATSAVKNQFVRYLIVRDTRQIESTIPTLTMMFGSATAGSTAHLAWSNNQRFKVYCDKTIFVGDTDEGRPFTVQQEKYIKLGFRVGYATTANTSQNENGLYLVTISGDATNPPDVFGEVRFMYTDW